MKSELSYKVSVMKEQKMNQLSAVVFARRMRWVFGGLTAVMAGLLVCLFLLGWGVCARPEILRAEISGVSAMGLSFGTIIAGCQCRIWNRSFHGREAGRLLSYTRTLYGLAFLSGVFQCAFEIWKGTALGWNLWAAFGPVLILSLLFECGWRHFCRIAPKKGA